MNVAVDRRVDGHVVWCHFKTEGAEHKCCAGEPQAVVDSKELAEIRGSEQLARTAPPPATGVQSATQGSLDALAEAMRTLQVKDKKPAKDASRSGHGMPAPPPGEADVFAVLRSLSAGVPKTETALKRKIMSANPTISRKDIRKFSGKCVIAADREMNLPLTIPVIKGEELKTEIEELSPQGKMLVVLVLAVYASQSAFALSQAQAALTDLSKKYPEGMPMKFVAVELSESRELASQLGDKKPVQPPSCLMFYRGSEVYRTKLAGGCERLRYPSLARPRVLLVEPMAANQLVSEGALRRCGIPFDLALSVHDAVRMAQNRYGAVLASSECGAQALVSVFNAHRSALPFLIHSPDQFLPDLNERGRISVQHVFPRPLRKTAVESVLTACKELAPTFAHSGTNKEEFTAEIERVFASAVSGSRTA